MNGLMNKSIDSRSFDFVIAIIKQLVHTDNI